MATTLIVRDATLAINGAPERRGEPHDHLRGRIEDVSRMDPRTAEECMEVLNSAADGEQADPEVLEALVIVALAHPPLGSRLGLTPVATGRRLATRHERIGEVDRALAVLEVLSQYFPGQESLERDLATVMRRQGMVQNLVERYFERAQKLIREGRNEEASGWLREVLQLDRSRKDAARLIRDLRFRARTQSHKRSVRWRFVLGAVVFSLVVTALVQRELALYREFQALPQGVEGNAVVLRRRLADLEDFNRRHPVWHGVYGLLSERSRLRVELEMLEEQVRVERERVEREQHERLESADLCYRRALPKVENGDVQGALVDLRMALQFGGPDWTLFEQVTRHVADLEAHLESER